MTDKLQLGAIDTETNKYVSPTKSLKGKNYKCIECDKKVILRKGTIRKVHFAHYAQTNVCNYYDHPNESQISEKCENFGRFQNWFWDNGISPINCVENDKMLSF